MYSQTNSLESLRDFLMKPIVAVFGGIIIVIMTISFMILFWSFGILNREAELSNRIHAKQQTVKQDYDATFNILKNQGMLVEKDREAFIKFYPELMAGQYGNMNDPNWVWVAPATVPWNNTLSTDFFKSLESQFKARANTFKQLADLGREHNTLLDTIPHKLIFSLAGRSKITLQFVTSSNTQDAFRTGTDDNNNFVR
jgi:hypothetical protein